MAQGYNWEVEADNTDVKKTEVGCRDGSVVENTGTHVTAHNRMCPPMPEDPMLSSDLLGTASPRCAGINEGKASTYL